MIGSIPAILPCLCMNGVDNVDGCGVGCSPGVKKKIIWMREM